MCKRVTLREMSISSPEGKEKLLMLDVILKGIDTPGETSVFEKGKFEIVRVGGDHWQGELRTRLKVVGTCRPDCGHCFVKSIMLEWS